MFDWQQKIRTWSGFHAVAPRYQRSVFIYLCCQKPVSPFRSSSASCCVNVWKTAPPAGHAGRGDAATCTTVEVCLGVSGLTRIPLRSCCLDDPHHRPSSFWWCHFAGISNTFTILKLGGSTRTDPREVTPPSGPRSEQGMGAKLHRGSRLLTSVDPPPPWGDPLQEIRPSVVAGGKLLLRGVNQGRLREVTWSMTRLSGARDTKSTTCVNKQAADGETGADGQMFVLPVYFSTEETMFTSSCFTFNLQLRCFCLASCWLLQRGCISYYS